MADGIDSRTKLPTFITTNFFIVYVYTLEVIDNFAKPVLQLMRIEFRSPGLQDMGLYLLNLLDNPRPPKLKSLFYQSTYVGP